MPSTAFLLVALAATLHTLWNFFTKKATGDLATIWNGLAMACVVFTPFIFFLAPEKMAFNKVYPHIIASGIIHSFYFYYLAKAYEHGELSLVYPQIKFIQGFNENGICIDIFFWETMKDTLDSADNIMKDFFVATFRQMLDTDNIKIKLNISV